MSTNMSRRNALTMLGKITLLSACGGSSTLFPPPGTGLFALYPPRAFAQNMLAVPVTPVVLNATGAFSFALKSGALPPGLILDKTTGSITGTPTTRGWSNFSIEVTNGTAKTTAWCNYFVQAAHHLMQNHWVANTGGRYAFPPIDNPSLQDLMVWNGNAGNFLCDIGLIDSSLGVEPDGLPIQVVQTLTYYEESSLGNPLYAPPRSDRSDALQLGANYYGGRRIGKGFSDADPEKFKDVKAIDSRKATNASGLTATIVNFYGRFFNLGEWEGMKNDPVPTGGSAPYVALSDGRHIRAIADPSAVGFDPQGRLWIADNGPDQNIKIFNLAQSLTTPVAIFGEPGGVYSGADGKRIGQTGSHRFWGLRGIVFDRQGFPYIACTGHAGQIYGGTDIRKYSKDGSELLWQIYGTFLDTASADPSTLGKKIYLGGKCYTMDYSKAPGASTTWSAVTLDPFRYPDDVRLTIPFVMLGIRRIAGKRFMYLGTMAGRMLSVFRFEDEATSEIAVQCAYLCLQEKNLGHNDVSPLHPTWEDNETNIRNRWAWRDSSGDGRFSSTSEFVIWENWTMYAQGIDVDDNGGIWYGGGGKISEYYRANGLQYWPCNGIDGNGVPIYDFAHPQRFDVPFGAEGNNGVNRLKYIAQTDTMYLAGGDSAWWAKSIYCYKNFRNPATRTLAYRIDSGFYDNADPENVHLDQGTAPMTLAMSFTADQDYIYVTYLDNGKDGRVRGEVTIYSAATGLQVDFILPGDPVGNRCGTCDVVNGIHVATDADGWKIIMLEDDGGAKVMVYRWKP